MARHLCKNLAFARLGGARREAFGLRTVRFTWIGRGSFLGHGSFGRFETTIRISAKIIRTGAKGVTRGASSGRPRLIPSHYGQAMGSPVDGSRQSLTDLAWV